MLVWLVIGFEVLVFIEIWAPTTRGIRAGVILSTDGLNGSIFCAYVNEANGCPFRGGFVRAQVYTLLHLTVFLIP
ncbi:hypothetical protein L873DRAFT_1799483 [Choiromyces venosus 120613-1]|uniref:Secreted protein n=1 Tax=Choiromyces venosus 120613-1 TaxID=1336337 RepID=A0A3N4K1X6_9PEZI|nr:hypothetical protein L873DRAFT_1799483 [Choiromyces venosus 120613-1]